MTNNKSKEIIYLNVILTFLVVLLHSDCLIYATFSDNIYNISYLINSIISLIGHMAVPTFFCISSFLFFKNYNPKKYIEKIKSRFVSLIIPYFLWSVIFFIYAFILTKSGILNNFDNSFPKVELSFQYILKAIIFSEYNGVMWYIRDLFVLFLLAPIIYKISTNTKSFLLVIIITIVFNCIYKPSYSNVIYWLPIYTFSSYLTLNRISLVHWINKKKVLFFYIVFFVFLITINILYNNYYFIYFFRNMAPLFVFIAIYNIKKNNFNIIERLNKYTFLIYCTHGNLVAIVRKLLSTIFDINPFILIVLRFLTALITIAIIIITFKILNKFFPKLVSIFCGGRIN